LIEKILRVQPCVRTLFLLVRAADDTSAKQRLQKEIIDKELFKVLREQHGHEYDGFMLNKIVPVAGDTSAHNLGITEQSVRDHLCESLHVIVHTAASTRFDERYDIALGVNTMGVNNILNFGKKCRNLQVLVHVSTAGVIREKSLQMGETLIDDTHVTLDIKTELNLVKRRAEEIEKSADPTAKTLTKHMKELGLQRASKYGWPNTYTFTKAMGEMLVGERRGDLPVVIIRPSVIESTFADPFPGWMEGSSLFEEFKGFKMIIHTGAKGLMSSTRKEEPHNSISLTSVGIVMKYYSQKGFTESMKDCALRLVEGHIPIMNLDVFLPIMEYGNEDWMVVDRRNKGHTKQKPTSISDKAFYSKRIPKKSEIYTGQFEGFPKKKLITRTMDTIIIGYGKGRITSFLANPDFMLDV
ncbi:hypothetical protein KI387_042466, partial [Taxus chinensis]